MKPFYVKVETLTDNSRVYDVYFKFGDGYAPVEIYNAVNEADAEITAEALNVALTKGINHEEKSVTGWGG